MLKGHSQGEYVFDHAWADAWQRAGGSYYPKLQIAAPFTPGTGRGCCSPTWPTRPPLLRAAERLVPAGTASPRRTRLSSSPRNCRCSSGPAGSRAATSSSTGSTAATASFDDFLAALSCRKRKTIRKERRGGAGRIEIRAFTGAEIRPEHWDAFWLFYMDTGSRKWG